MADEAFLVNWLVDPETGLVSGWRVQVNYGPRQAHLNIPPVRPGDGNRPSTEELRQALRELGTALLHIADQPSAVFGQPRHRN